MSNSIMLKITDAAILKAKELLSSVNDGSIAIKIGILQGGCSGLSYNIDLVKEIKDSDEVVDEKGIKFIIEPAATLFLIGSTVDWQQDKFKSGFVFINPNETSRCGCGESFSV